MGTFFQYDLDKIVVQDHPLRKVSTVISFRAMAYRIKELDTGSRGREGYGLEVAMKCLFLQFFYDLSDRQAEEYFRYNIAVKWFLGFKIDDPTPDHSFFGRVRSTIGASRVHKLLRLMNEQARKKGVMKEFFTFVDASAIKTKEATWKERDQALAQGEEKLNNANISNYSADPDARFGCKGKEKFWYGYKRHVSVDMGSGLIDTVAVTPANVTDQDGLELICPKNRIVFGDKAYGLKPAQKVLKHHGCESAAILKNNAKLKDWNLDRSRSRLRMPFESTFSKFRKRARYRGLAKVQFQASLDAFVFNVRRLMTLTSPPLFAGA